MRSIGFGTLTFLFLSSLNASALEDKMSIQSATSIASETGQNIFIKFEADWCLPCKIMTQTVFSDNEVLQLLTDQFITVSANIEHLEDKEWFEKYSVNKLPTLAVLSPNGSILYKTEGSLTSQIFLENFGTFGIPKSHKSLTTYKRKMKEERDTKLTSLRMNKLHTEVNQPLVEVFEKYTVTVGAFAFKQNAIDFQKELLTRFGEKAFIEQSASNHLFRLNIGRYEHREDAHTLVRNLKKDKVDCYVRLL